jgi:hypothetical protein
LSTTGALMTVANAPDADGIAVVLSATFPKYAAG